MIRLNSALCSKDLRKTGIVLSCVNIFLQVVGVVTVIVLYSLSARRRGWPDNGLFGGSNWFYTQAMRYLLLDAIFCLVVDILLYILLLLGLIKRKVAVLTVWLIFSVFEFLLIQVGLFIVSFIWTTDVNAGLGILCLIVQILAAGYMYYVACIVFSVRYNIVSKKNPTQERNPNTVYAQFNTNAAAVNVPNAQPVQFGVGVPQYTIASQPLVVPATSSTLTHQNFPSTTIYQKDQPPAYSM